jgi:hypothetical protein
MSLQHSSLSHEKWSQFTLDEQILMISNEMNRARKHLESSNAARLRNCYERVLNLTDLTIRANSKPTLLRELLRWRDLIAELFVSAQSTIPEAEDHKQAFKVLLLFTPEASKQRPYVVA